MTKRERVQAALARRPVDRPPVAFWRHVPEVDHTSGGLAEVMLAFQRRWDLDLIKRAFPAPQTGVRMGGNVDYTTIPCFANPEQRDFSPRAGSLLKGAGVYWGDAWVPREDFFGVRRSVAPLPGAFERPSGPLSLIPQS